PSGWSPVESTSIGWIPGDNTGLEVPTVEAGTGLPSPTDLHYANGTYRGPFSSDAVIDQELATLLRASVGSVVWVSSQSVSGPHALAAWYANATAFRVVGISSPFWLLPSVTLGFFYLSELQQLEGDSSPATDYASVVLIHLTDPTTAGSDQSRLEQTFPGITVFTLANILGEVQQVVNLYRTFGTLIGAIGLVVATLFTSTVLLMSVDDHSREIALRRALGFSRAAIARLVLEEAVALSAGGLLIGLAIGWLGSAAINRFLDALVPGLPNGFSFVTFDLALLGTAIGLVLGLGLLASILPLARAMSFPVAEELRAP
ncbi:MAG: FtsX-like permease family protein, partial [Thermoplasmata archaeon]